MSQNKSEKIPSQWQTLAEKSNYKKTPRYDETIAYCKRLDAASPLIRYQSFGESGEGRELPLLIAATNETFTPPKARRANKAVVLIQACIHPGEPDGKDAGFALLRDIAITKTRTNLLNKVVIVFIPLYNADGHEIWSAYNRINQNGPDEMGFRGTSANQNLNRDYMKADTPETRSWLKLWNKWNPDLFIDCHVTDGADYQYNLTYEYARHQEVNSNVREWADKAFQEIIFPAVEKEGNLISAYLQFADNRDFTKGISTFIAAPRFATGYVPLRNRPGLLIETHSLKDYRSRVRGTYDLLRHTLEEVNRDPKSLINAVKKADEETIAAGRTYDGKNNFPLRLSLTDKSVPYVLKAVESKTEKSVISDAVRVIFGNKPVDVTVPRFDESRVSASIIPPLFYIVPSQWREVIERLEWHGIKFKRLTKPLTIEVETYRFTEVAWETAPFEGRVPVTFKSTTIKTSQTLPTNSVVVPLDQATAAVAIHLLEPDSPDSFVTWGFFNAIFEQKEYFEPYIMEKIAREMLAGNRKLKKEFEMKLANNPEFASDSHARLNFFFERSPYFDKRKNVYPVGRVLKKIKAAMK